jgi:hypothetical protein
VKNVLIFVAICLIGVGVYFGFIHKPSVQRAGDEVEIIPGIRPKLSSNDDAGKYYGKMIRSYLARGFPVSLTDDEWKWFMEATKCRECNLYPEQFPHIMPNGSLWEPRAMKNIATIVSREAEQRWRNHHDDEAQDLLRRVAVMGWHIEREKEGLMLKPTGVGIELMAYRGFINFCQARGRSHLADEYEQHIKAKQELFARDSRVFDVKDWSMFQIVKNIATAGEDSRLKKLACFSLTSSSFVLRDRKAQALHVLKTVAQKDPSAEVRQFAAACIPYADGTKKVPPPPQ